MYKYFHSSKMCMRCFRDYSYLTWGYFDKPLKNPILQFCGFWLSLSIDTHTLSCYQLPARQE